MSDVYIPTIPNATVTYYYNANGILRYTVTANEGYVLYSISEYNDIMQYINDGTLDGDITDYVGFFRTMYMAANANFDNIGTMAEQPNMNIYGLEDKPQTM